MFMFKMIQQFFFSLLHKILLTLQMQAGNLILFALWVTVIRHNQEGYSWDNYFWGYFYLSLTSGYYASKFQDVVAIMKSISSFTARWIRCLSKSHYQQEGGNPPTCKLTHITLLTGSSAHHFKAAIYQGGLQSCFTVQINSFQHCRAGYRSYHRQYFIKTLGKSIIFWLF